MGFISREFRFYFQPRHMRLGHITETSHSSEVKAQTLCSIFLCLFSTTVEKLLCSSWSPFAYYKNWYSHKAHILLKYSWKNHVTLPSLAEKPEHYKWSIFKAILRTGLKSKAIMLQCWSNKLFNKIYQIMTIWVLSCICSSLKLFFSAQCFHAHYLKFVVMDSTWSFELTRLA